MSAIGRADIGPTLGMSAFGGEADIVDPTAELLRMAKGGVVTGNSVGAGSGLHFKCLFLLMVGSGGALPPFPTLSERPLPSSIIRVTVLSDGI